MHSRSFILLLWIVWALIASATAAPTETTQEHRLALDIIDLTNQERRAAGLSTLDAAADLSAAARAHSQEMLDLSYFAHLSPNPAQRTVVERLHTLGGTDANLGENIARLTDCQADAIATMTVQAWMKSPGHRDNILDPEYNRIGLGVVMQGNRTLITQVFSARAVELEEVACVSTASGGMTVAMRGRVLQGQSRGAVLIDDVALAPWVAGQDGCFSVQFQVQHPVTVSVGQILDRELPSYTVVSEVHLRGGSALP